MRIRALYDNWVSPQRWMDRLRVGVALRVATGLVLLLSCVLLIARAVRLFPRDDQLQLSRRSAIAEMAALQAAVGISQHDEVLVGRVLEETVRRCDDVESAALCHDGTIVVQTAGHQKYWNGASFGRPPRCRCKTAARQRTCGSCSSTRQNRGENCNSCLRRGQQFTARGSPSGLSRRSD